MKAFVAIRLSIVVLIVTWCVSGIASPAIQKSSEKDRQLLVKSARILESDPLGKDSKKIREWAMTFVIQAPDVHIVLCKGYLGTLLGSKNSYEAELIGQEAISMASFVIEHPDQEKNDVAVHQAGVEGVLKAYEAILKTKPKAKLDYLDGLIVKRDKGELKAYVEDVSKTTCKPKS